MQSQSLRFTDAAMEAAYQEARRERDSLRARRVQLVLALLIAALTAIIMGVSRLRQSPLPSGWLWLRFGVLVPGLLLSSFLTCRPWGKAHLQTLLGFGLAVLVGAHTIEWFLEWTPAIPMRMLWMVPFLMLWAGVMTLPMSAKATVGATLGVLVIAQAGIAVVAMARLHALELGIIAFAYALCGFGLVTFARWRERDNRELFVQRREREQLAEKLGAQNATLEQLNRQRDEFVAGVLHDLRSPVTGVLLTADLLRTNPTLPVASRDTLLADMARSARRIDEFATHFLEQRSLERAAMKLELVAVPFAAAVERAVDRARLSAGRKQQQISLDLSVVNTAKIIADELLFDRALGNLLDNAVKFSPLGATISVGADAATPDRVRVLVRDTGRGLTEAEQAKLFQAYTRLGHKGTAGEPSTGLGLSLVKQWIEAMGGTVGCESMPGRGATFWLSLRSA
jgi:signal transduction histidine kinase